MNRTWAGAIAGVLVVLVAATIVSAADAKGTCVRATADRRNTAMTACTGCHGAPVTSGDRTTFQMPGRAFSHPVDVDYATARSKKPEKFVPAAELPEFITFLDGKITCLTCHDVHSGLKNALAADADGPLCLACHVLP